MFDGIEKHIFEIQANLSPCVDAQKQSHGFYETVRSELPNIVGDSADWKKVFRHISDRLNESTLDLTVATLIEKTDGLMVFAKLLADHLESVAGKDGQVEVEELEKLPAGLDDMYQTNFARAFGKPTELGWRKAKPIVAMIVAAGEPPPGDLLRRILGKATFDNVVLGKMSILFPMRSDGLVHVMHKSVVDWLAKDHAFALSSDDMKSAHVKLGEMCAKISGEILGAGEEALARVCDGERSMEVLVEKYAIHHGVMHLCEGG